MPLGKRWRNWGLMEARSQPERSLQSSRGRVPLAPKGARAVPHWLPACGWPPIALQP